MSYIASLAACNPRGGVAVCVARVWVACMVHTGLEVGRRQVVEWWAALGVAVALAWGYGEVEGVVLGRRLAWEEVELVGRMSLGPLEVGA